MGGIKLAANVYEASATSVIDEMPFFLFAWHILWHATCRTSRRQDYQLHDLTVI